MENVVDGAALVLLDLGRWLLKIEPPFGLRLLFVLTISIQDDLVQLMGFFSFNKLLFLLDFLSFCFPCGLHLLFPLLRLLILFLLSHFVLSGLLGILLELLEDWSGSEFRRSF